MKRFCSALTGSARRYPPWLPGLVLLAGLLAQAANACQVCIPMPVKTLADRLERTSAMATAL